MENTADLTGAKFRLTESKLGIKGVVIQMDVACMQPEGSHLLSLWQQVVGNQFVEEQRPLSAVAAPVTTEPDTSAMMEHQAESLTPT